MKYWIFAMMLLFLCSCDKSDEPIIHTGVEITKDELVAGLQDFQWDLFKQAVKESDPGQNVSISPISVASALYMAYEGSANMTRSEMSQVMGMPGSKHVGKAYSDLEQILTNTGEDTYLKMENSIFWDKNRMTANDDFLGYIGTHHDALISDLDFSQSSALTSINDWVKTSTEGRIEKILDEITSEDVMFLINALIFKADWAYPFPQENTIVGPFKRSDGSEVSVPMMFQDVYHLKSFEDENVKAVEMPFADTTFSMILLQSPTDNQSVDDFIEAISSTSIDQLLNQNLVHGRIYMHMPKFEIEFKMQMNTVLKELGMVEAFDDQQADFSNLGSSASGNLFLNKVLHKTFLKVDEKGADGAAVTSVGVGVTSLPPTFRFDRPFVALILDRRTGVQIFTAKIEDPS